MKTLLALPCLLFIYQLNAQKNIDGLVNAEKTFAAYSVEHGAKNAFLKFLDSNGIVFEQGKAANGIAVWKKKQDGPVVLDWAPNFAEISSSSDFGYTTGPWMLRPPGKDSIMATGRFTTVWHIDASGEWKFLLDLGVGNLRDVLNHDLFKITTKKIPGPASTSEVLKTEKNFIETFKNDKSKAYSLFLSKHGILNRNGFQPATDKTTRTEIIIATPADIQYTVTGSGVATSGDLAYVYGNTVINNKTENYLRIWRKEEEGWKVAVEVLRY
jgi:ketosteroid isomerase-like protein